MFTLGTYRIRIMALERGASAVAFGVFSVAFLAVNAWAMIDATMPPDLPPGTLVVSRFTETAITAAAFALVAWGAMRVRVERVERELEKRALGSDVSHASQVAAIASEHIRDEVRGLREEVSGLREELIRAREVIAAVMGRGTGKGTAQ